LEYAHDIHSSGIHLLDMINDILDISRIEAGRMELANEPVTFPEVVEQAIHMIEEKRRQADITIDADLPANLPGFYGDKRAMVQVLLNLLSNAVKFTPAGGTITIRAEIGEDGGISLTVADTGVGIPAEDLSALMQPFSQAGNQAAARESGTGLGLYLVKRLVEQQEGDFAISSEEGKGVTATIRMPSGRLLAA
jgi:signal transduction histidine kinase